MTDQKNTPFSTLREAIHAAKNIVVASHVNPDPDAYGSSGGMALQLRNLGKNVALVNESGINESLSFIPGVKEITKEIPKGTWDLVITCDCGDEKRMGDTLGPQLLSLAPLMNIDHHISNDFFGKWNLVVPEACSASEIVFDIFEGFTTTFSKDVSSCLYIGISGDTGSFRYSSTTTKTFHMAECLVKNGASPSELASALFGRRSVASLRLQAAALANLKFYDNGKVAVIVADEAAYTASNAKREDADSLVDLARNVEGVEVAALIKQDADIWKVSMRSNGKVNVSEIAAEFGGGGHKAAAGFRFKQSRAELERLLFARLSLGVKDL